jgi:flap endonuclease-1
MGVKLSSIIPAKTITLSDLSGKTIAIDAFNMLYQFLSTIRGPDGSPLSTSRGEVSSHLVGLFARTTSFLEKGLKPVFVFDGKAPEMKRAEQDKRREAKLEAKQLYEAAKHDQDIEAMKKYASRLSRLTPTMVLESKQLLDLLGVPWIDAPSEGEAQAAAMVRSGQVWGSASEDFDSLLFASPRHVRQLTVSGKRRKAGKIGTYTVEPEVIELPAILTALGLSQRQLIALGILIGTDFNPGGVKGIGPKKALKLLAEHAEDFETIFAQVEYDAHCDVAWNEIMSFFENPPVAPDIAFSFSDPDEYGLVAFLCERFEFSEQRVRDGAAKSRTRPKQQTGLGSFL